MQKFTFHRKITGFFTDQQDRLAYDQESLLPFIQRVFSREAFLKQVDLKQANYPDSVRSTLVKVLNAKYATIDCSAQTRDHLNLLRQSTTFTVTTGHQLSLATGPIFSVYKILHVIRLAEEVNADNDSFNVVPVFWMASEDHDFEEVRSVDVFNTRLVWESEEKGAVGRMSTSGLNEIKDEIRQLFNQNASDQLAIFLDAWKGETYGEVFFNLIHFLFDRYGLLIIDGDNRELKTCFKDSMKREIQDMVAFNSVQKTNELLHKDGAKIQVNPRETNLFYLSKNSRDRIIPEGGNYKLNNERQHNLYEVLAEIEAFPERFSPNVILRPVFQELVLPNLCYIGGVGEIAYWLQLKATFDAFDVVYPLIAPRISMLWIDPATSKKMAKVNLSIEDLFREVSAVKKDVIFSNSNHLDFNKIDDLLERLSQAFLSQSKTVDVNAEKMTAAELVKVKKQVDLIKDKLLKSLKQQHETTLNQVDQVYAKVFPEGSLQERRLNLLSMCPSGAIHERIEQLHDVIDPFNMDFVVLKES